MSDYDEFQAQLKSREFCIGWRQEGSQKRVYYQVIFDDWHEANAIACNSTQPGYIPFVEPVTVVSQCPNCNGTGIADIVGNWHTCTYCHGKGRIREA